MHLRCTVPGPDFNIAPLVSMDGKSLRIGYFYRTKVPDHYMEFEPNDDPWYKSAGKKTMLVEKAVVTYLGWKHPQHTYIKLDAHKFDKALARSCDIVWLAFEEPPNLFKYLVAWAKKPATVAARKRKYEKVLDDIMSLPNLFPPRKVNDFIFDKCKYYAAAKRWGIPIEDTYCTTSVSIQTAGLRRKMNALGDKVYVKPLPSSEAFGNIVFQKPYDTRAIDEYLKEMRSTGVDRLCVQKFNPNFATKKYPEYRTVWVGRHFCHGIKTEGAGYTTGEMKRIPAKLRQACIGVIDRLEEKFRVPMITLRIDWGKTPDGEYFLNEIEQAYGTFIDELSYRTRLEKKIGDEFMSKALAHMKLR